MEEERCWGRLLLAEASCYWGPAARARPGCGRAGVSAGGSAVLWPGVRFCIFIRTACCFLCQRQSARRASSRLAPQGGGAVRAGRVVLLPSRDAVSASRWVCDVPPGVEPFATGLRPGPESASSVSESEAIVRHGVPGARCPPGGWCRFDGPGARVRCSPSQRQSARCAKIRNFPLGEWSPRFGPGGPVLSRTAAAERSSQRPSPQGAGGRAVRSRRGAPGYATSHSVSGVLVSGPGA